MVDEMADIEKMAVTRALPKGMELSSPAYFELVRSR